MNSIFTLINELMESSPELKKSFDEQMSTKRSAYRWESWQILHALTDKSDGIRGRIPPFVPIHPYKKVVAKQIFFRRTFTGLRFAIGEK